MTIFESKVNIERPLNEVYTFLADMNNHRELMPDNILDWSSITDEANFTIQNMASLSLHIENRIENKEIKIIPLGKPPFDMELKWVLNQSGVNTGVEFTISAQLNMMMKMFAAGPLQSLADHETQALHAILTQSS